MTPVAAPPAPAQSSTGPNVPTKADDVFASLIGESVAQAMAPALDPDVAPVSTDPDDEAPEDRTEPTTAGDTKPSVDAKPAKAAVATKAAPLPALPDGFAHVPTIAKDAATDFTVSDAEGEIEPPALFVDFVANGKLRKEPLEKVVKLAQWGVYNHARHQQAEAAMLNATQSAITAKAAEERMAEMERTVDALMTSDEAYLAARADYDRQHTPEAKLAAKEAHVASEQERLQFTAAAQSGKQFMESRVAPALTMIAQHLPSITEDELAARVLLLANQYTVHTLHGAIIHPDAHSTIANAIANDVLPWAQQVHDARMRDRNGVLATAQQQVDTARVETQKAKNLAARSLKPSGRAAPDVTPRKPPRTADEAHDEVLRATLEAVGVR